MAVEGQIGFLSKSTPRLVLMRQALLTPPATAERSSGEVYGLPRVGFFIFYFFLRDFL
jgi:hypothetical protein